MQVKSDINQNRLRRLKNKELLSIEDGGLSYWSNKTHRWIQGRFDKKKYFYSSK